MSPTSSWCSGRAATSRAQARPSSAATRTRRPRASVQRASRCSAGAPPRPRSQASETALCCDAVLGGAYATRLGDRRGARGRPRIAVAEQERFVAILDSRQRVEHGRRGEVERPRRKLWAAAAGQHVALHYQIAEKEHAAALEQECDVTFRVTGRRNDARASRDVEGSVVAERLHLADLRRLRAAVAR